MQKAHNRILHRLLWSGLALVILGLFSSSIKSFQEGDGPGQDKTVGINEMRFHEGRYHPRAAQIESLQVQARSLVGNLTVVARVFYGRHASLEILDCYLRRNLKRNGGLLDHVEFYIHQVSDADSLYVQELLFRNPDYSARYPAITHTNKKDYSVGYNETEDDVLYFKIDDDVVFIDDATIPSMLIAHFEHPEFPLLSANVVRHSILSNVHSRTGAIRPIAFVKDFGINNKADWRMSKTLEGEYPEVLENFEEGLQSVSQYSWLPISSAAQHKQRHGLLRHTPMEAVEYDSAGKCSLMSPFCSVQCHLSFFMNMEQNTMSRYDFGMWDFHHASNPTRYSINFILWRGQTVHAGGHMNSIPTDDEFWLTVHLPHHFGIHSAAVGRAVVSHLSYGIHWGFGKPDYRVITRKYRHLAQSQYCSVMNGYDIVASRNTSNTS